MRLQWRVGYGCVVLCSDELKVLAELCGDVVRVRTVVYRWVGVDEVVDEFVCDGAEVWIGGDDLREGGYHTME